jgi:hypothetical protein
MVEVVVDHFNLLLQVNQMVYQEDQVVVELVEYHLFQLQLVQVEQELQVKEIQVDVENKELYIMQVEEEDLDQLVIQVQVLQTHQLVEQDQM